MEKTALQALLGEVMMKQSRKFPIMSGKIERKECFLVELGISREFEVE